MKAKFYTLITLVAIFASSCRSIEKMVDKGQYEEALSFAANKLAGEKNKQTKYVVGLETAYQQLVTRDENEIDLLAARGLAQDWEKIHTIYDRMNRRQAIVAPLNPLVSKDGYLASFNLKNFGSLQREVGLKASELYYQEVLSLLDKAENDSNKSAARSAYYLMDKIARYEPSYKDIRDLRIKASDLGIVTIGVDVKQNHMGMYTSLVSDRLADLNPSRLNSKWNRFEYIDFDSKEYDKYLVIELENLDFGSERETNNNYEVTNKIQDGFVYIKDRSGKPLKDTLGHDIKEPKFINVTAWVTETFREKHSSVAAKIQLYDNKSSYASQSIPIILVHDFQDSAIKFRGDRRALDTNLCNRLDDHLSSFPSDLEAANYLGKNLLAAVENTAKSMYIKE